MECESYAFEDEAIWFEIRSKASSKKVGFVKGKFSPGIVVRLETGGFESPWEDVNPAGAAFGITPHSYMRHSGLERARVSLKFVIPQHLQELQ